MAQVAVGEEVVDPADQIRVAVLVERVVGGQLLEDLGAGEGVEAHAAEDAGGEHRLGRQHAPGAVAAHQHQGEAGDGLVMDVAQQLDAVPGQQLGLVDDHHAIVLGQQLHDASDGAEAVQSCWAAGELLEQGGGHQPRRRSGGEGRPDRRPPDGLDGVVDGEGLAQASLAVDDSHRVGLRGIANRAASEQEVVGAQRPRVLELKEVPGHAQASWARSRASSRSVRASAAAAAPARRVRWRAAG